MKIFVGYGFSEDRDRWIPDLIFPLIRAFGDEVVTGEELHGEQITDAVRRKIAESDALIGFLTRRGTPDAGGIWKTHRWVIEEIASALSPPLERFVLEIREDSVDEQGGIVGDRQYIIYRENARDRCLVEIAKTIGKWHTLERLKLKLLPEDHRRELLPLLRDPDLRCTYKIMTEDGADLVEKETRIVPMSPGGLFLFVKDVPRDAYIQIHIQHHGTHWLSDFEGTEMRGIYLRKES